ARESMTTPVAPAKTAHPVRRVLALYRPYRWRLVLSQVLLLLSAVATLGTAALNQRLVNDGLLAGDTWVIVDTGIWMAVLGTVASVLLAGTAVIAVFFSQGTAYVLRTQAYASVQEYSFGNFDQMRTGNLLVRLSSDVNNVANAVLYGVMLLLYAPIMLIAAVGLASITAPGMVWILGVVTVILLGFAVILIRPMERAYDERQKRLDEVNNTMQENLAGVRVVKAFGREELEVERFDARTEALRVPARAAAFRVALLTPALNTVTQLGIAITLLIGGTKVIDGDGMTIGQVTAFTQYLSLVVVPLGLAALITPYLLRGVTSAARVFQVIDAEPLLPAGGATELATSGGAEVRFEGVSFGYQGGDDASGDVLHDIDLVIEPGQSLGILGATGSGKTSLVNLIPRFYDPRQGRVLIDGVDVRDVPLDQLRSVVGAALQEAVLFQGDVRQNVCFADPAASDDRMKDAARASDAFGFVEALPQQWDAPVARRGYNFSGGQRQRLSMARALVPRPRVLILDDSTSALDVATETRVQAAIPKDVAGTTLIYVAQRISAVIDLDRIVLLERGRIADIGTHTELLARSDLYREIYQSQLGAIEEVSA
ncbi:MAG: ABC transporter ATP-binding protein/permease, partial [Propionibacteriales bacterium]|nr:ABC transporter ATP-binding protein/permease [Propionibacteriales bacterium]